MKRFLATIAIPFAICAALLVLPLFTHRALTADEILVRDLVREVHGENIISEKLTVKGGTAVFVIELHEGKYAELQINLSSLAENHRHGGVSIPALRKAIRMGQ